MDKNIWEKDEYYKVIKDAHPDNSISRDPILEHFIKLLKENKTESVLDVGCGEGWLIEQISRQLGNKSLFTGIDISTTGLEMAKKRNISKAKFTRYDGKILPFLNETFSVALSSFVFEHLSDPMNIFNEMNRVVKKDGLIIIACPNFGSPLLKSPCNKKNRMRLIIARFFKELRPKKYFKNDFHWDFVEPIALPPNMHLSDYDTLCEPNLSSFEKFLASNQDKYSLVEIGSLWDAYDYKEISVKSNPSLFRQWLFSFVRFLGMKKIFRFQYFGSFFFAAIKKL